MTSQQPITEDRPLAWTTPDGRYTITVAATRFTHTVTVYSGTYRHDALCRTFEHESDARDLARLIATMLRDGATVAQVLEAIQPAADVIAAATALLVLDADVRKLSQPQRDAIRSATAGHITRSQVSTVKTLYALEAAKLGTCTRVGYRVTGLNLNARGRQMQAHILAHTVTVTA